MNHLSAAFTATFRLFPQLLVFFLIVVVVDFSADVFNAADAIEVTFKFTGRKEPHGNLRVYINRGLQAKGEGDLVLSLDSDYKATVDTETDARFARFYSAVMTMPDKYMGVKLYNGGTYLGCTSLAASDFRYAGPVIKSSDLVTGC